VVAVLFRLFVRSRIIDAALKEFIRQRFVRILKASHWAMRITERHQNPTSTISRIASSCTGQSHQVTLAQAPRESGALLRFRLHQANVEYRPKV